MKLNTTNTPAALFMALLCLSGFAPGANAQFDAKADNERIRKAFEIQKENERKQSLVIRGAVQTQLENSNDRAAAEQKLKAWETVNGLRRDQDRQTAEAQDRARQAAHENERREANEQARKALQNSRRAEESGYKLKADVERRLPAGLPVEAGGAAKDNRWTRVAPHGNAAAAPRENPAAGAPVGGSPGDHAISLHSRTYAVAEELAKRLEAAVAQQTSTGTFTTQAQEAALAAVSQVFDGNGLQQQTVNFAARSTELFVQAAKLQTRINDFVTKAEDFKRRDFELLQECETHNRNQPKPPATVTTQAELEYWRRLNAAYDQNRARLQGRQQAFLTEESGLRKLRDELITEENRIKAEFQQLGMAR